MNPDTKEPEPVQLESDWVQDAFTLKRAPDWVKWLALAFTFISCCLYIALFSLISEYQLQVMGIIRELPIFTRIVLNIYQPFLVVFIIISLSLFILLYLRIKRPVNSYKPFMVLIIFNSLFAAILLGVSFLRIN